jgi:hypothetical protein
LCLGLYLEYYTLYSNDSLSVDIILDSTTGFTRY